MPNESLFDTDLTPLPPEPLAEASCTCCPQQTRNADFVCDDCVANLFTVCSRCEHRVRVGAELYSDIFPDSIFCEDCFMTAVLVCNGCTAAFDGSLLTEVDGNRYCEQCHRTRFIRCAGCEANIGIDAVSYVDEYDGDSYCCNCAPDDEIDDDTEWEQGSRVTGVTFARIGSARRFGVELEISGCRKHSGLQGQTVFGAKYDGSLSAGKEFVSPVLQGDEGLDAVAALCDYGKANDWTVDSSCGYHVHIDAGDLSDSSLASVAMAYMLTESVWTRFVSKARSENDYCKKLPYKPETMRDANWGQFLGGVPDRYYWFNLQSYERHQTVEIRLHSGTVNYDKITNWVKIHTRFVDAVSKMQRSDLWAMFYGKSDFEKFEAIMRLAGDETLSAFYLARAAKMKQPIKPDPKPKTPKPVEVTGVIKAEIPDDFADRLRAYGLVANPPIAVVSDDHARLNDYTLGDAMIDMGAYADYERRIVEGDRIEVEVTDFNNRNDIFAQAYGRSFRR